MSHTLFSNNTSCLIKQNKKGNYSVNISSNRWLQQVAKTINPSGSINQTSCEAGFYQQDYSQDKCEECPAKNYCEGGAVSTPIICPTGVVQEPFFKEFLFFVENIII